MPLSCTSSSCRPCSATPVLSTTTIRSALPDRRQPVRDHQCRPAHREFLQARLDRPLRLRVQRARRPVRDQDRQLFRNIRAIARRCSTAGELHAALADHRIDPGRQPRNHLVQLCPLPPRRSPRPTRPACHIRCCRESIPRRGRHPAARSRPPAAARPASCRAGRSRRSSGPLSARRSARQRGDRRLARARGADERDRLTGADRRSKSVQDADPPCSRKQHARSGSRPATTAPPPAFGRSVDIRLDVQQFLVEAFLLAIPSDTTQHRVDLLRPAGRRSLISSRKLTKPPLPPLTPSHVSATITSGFAGPKRPF